MKKTKEDFPDKSLKPKRHPVRQKLLSCLLSVCLLLVSLPVEFYGSEVQAEEMVQEIMSFSELPEEVLQQTTDTGTAQESLSLPDTLWAVCVFAESEPVMLEHITWQSAPVYDKDTEGTYVFTPVLPESFVLAEGTGLPEISVTVMNAGDMFPEKETVQTVQEPEEILMEGSKSDRDFAEDMDLQMDKIPEERIAVVAEGEETEEVGEEPECKTITQDTVWKEGNLENGTVTLENNATLTINGQVNISGTVNIVGEGTIEKGKHIGHFNVDSDDNLTINGNIIMDGKSIAGACPFIMVTGKLTVDGECVIQNVTVNTERTYIISPVYVIDGSAVLNNVTIKNCSVPYYGGAIGNRNGSIIINGGVYENNTATERGGCIYSDRGTVTINGGTFRSNRAEEGNGGCIYAIKYSNLIINGGTFTDNKAESSNENVLTMGGCIYTEGDLTVTGGNFSDNTAREGGCIYTDSTAAAITGGAFTDNSAEEGGAIYSDNNLEVTGGIFNNNITEKAGGAIYSDGNKGKFYLEGDVEFQGIDSSPTSYTDSVYSYYLNSIIYSREKWLHPVKVFVGDAEKRGAIFKGEGEYQIQKEDVENIHVYDMKTERKWYNELRNNYVYITLTNPGLYNIFYDSNGAQGTPVTDETDYHTGAIITVKEPTGLSITGQTFKEWNTQADGKGTSYAPGAEITVGEEDITLYAIFEEKAKDTFTARFYSGEAKRYTDQESADRTLAAPEPEALGDGWMILGWNRNQDDFEKNSIAPGDTIILTEALTEFYGVYQKKVTLTCETDGKEEMPGPEEKTCYASVHNEIKVKGAAFTVKAGPVRKGYKFLGWNTRADGKGTFYQEKEPLTTEKNITLYACYEREGSGTETLIADFYSGSGGGKESRTVEVDGSGQEGTIHAPKLQEMAGWTPLGWSYSDSEYRGTVGADTDIKIKEHISLYGVYRKDITLTYDGNGSTDVPEAETKSRYANVHGEVTYQEAEFIPEAVSTRGGYRFVCWNTRADGKGESCGKGDVLRPQENLTLYAVWEEDPEVADYRVEYYCQNLTGEEYTRMDADTKLLANVTGTEVEARQKKYTGFTLNLSHPSGKPKGKVEGDGSLVLKLYYDRNIYEVDFNLNGGYGTGPDTQKVRYGGLLEPVSDPVQSGYNFKGWYVDDDGLNGGLWDFESPVENNTGTLKTTLYARWADEAAPVMGEASFGSGHKNFQDWIIQKKGIEITVPVTEEGSGLARAEYLLMAEDGTERDGTADIAEKNGLSGQMTAYGSSASVIRAVQSEAERGSYEARIVIEEEFKGKVLLTCTDYAGNVSAGKVLTAEGGIILEDNAPEISFSGTKESMDGKPLEVKVEVKDDDGEHVAGGISGIRYQVDKDRKTEVSDRKFNQDITETCEFTVKISGEGKHSLQVEAEDHAGNKSKAEISLKINGKKDTPAGEPGDSGTDSAGRTGRPPGGEPKTGDSTQIQICATLAMIAGFGYLLLYFEGENGITEQEKEEIIYRLVEWAKQGGRIRRLLGVAVIFLFLAYYHSIGKSVTVEWREVCVEKTGRNSGF